MPSVFLVTFDEPDPCGQAFSFTTPHRAFSSHSSAAAYAAEMNEKNHAGWRHPPYKVVELTLHD